MNYNASQESVSGGLRKCRMCGKPFVPVRNSSRYKECSVECAKIRKGIAKKEWDIKNIKHVKEYRINHRPLVLDKIKKWKHDFYINHKTELYKKYKEYLKRDRTRLLLKQNRLKNKTKIIKRRKQYRARNPGQIKERDFLLSQYKTSKVPMYIKKLTALTYIGRRITGFNQSKPIQFSDVKNKISLVKKGKTYEAYL